MLEKNVRRQVLIPLTLTFVILITSFLYTSYRIRMDEYASGLTHRYHHVQNILESLIAGRTKSMMTAAEFIAGQKRFQWAMIAGDREALLQHASAIRERLVAGQQITHFNFYDTAGRNILRIYQPDDTSESSERFTKRQAMEKGTPVSGLELGRVGAFTLRLTYPWWVEGELIGYIEFGQEIDHILQELKEITEIDFLISLDKSHLERDAWEEGMRILGRRVDWDFLPDKVVIDQTISMPASVAAGLIASRTIDQESGSVFEFDKRSYRARSFPLYDAARRSVGEFILLKDITKEVSSFRSFLTRVVPFSLVLSATLFAFAFRVLGRVDRRLVQVQESLSREFEKQADTNQKLETEIAERRRAEEKLIVLNESLEQRVLERTSELKALNAEIEASRAALEEAYRDLQIQQATILQQDKMACIGQLAAGVAHDINNPIGFVAGNLEVIQKYWDRTGEFLKIQSDALNVCAPPELLEHVEQSRGRLKIDHVAGEFPAVMAECLDGAERVTKIVLNLKGFSRIDEEGARIADIHECLESTIGIVSNELRYKASLVRRYGEISPLYCCPQQLNQVFMNLLINAAQAIDRWGEITIRTWAERQKVFISIGDTGCGIPEEHLSNIFEPFYTTKKAGGGTGLGLSIVYDIIKQHGGAISVESTPGKGTLFTIELPLQAQEARSA